MTPIGDIHHVKYRSIIIIHAMFYILLTVLTYYFKQIVLYLFIY